MDITRHTLENKFGLDSHIASYFADRSLLANNLLSENNRVYIQDQLRYISIPLFYDGLLKSGVAFEQINNEAMISTMEQCFNLMVLHEKGKISHITFLNNCLELYQPFSNHWMFDSIKTYLENGFKPYGILGTQYKSLNRSDVFLLALCNTKADIRTTIKFLKYWYSFNSCILILDDIQDFESDLKNNEMNFVLEVGNQEEKVHELYNYYAAGLMHNNVILYNYFINANKLKIQHQ
jgi:hypothetical protein